MRELKIRQLKEEDLDNMKAFEDDEKIDELFPKFWETKFGEKNCLRLVGEIDGKIIAYAHLNKWKGGNHSIGIAVLEDYRKKGIGSLMVRQLIGLAKTIDIDSIIYRTKKFNEPSIGLAKSLGFELIRSNPADKEYNFELKL